MVIISRFFVLLLLILSFLITSCKSIPDCINKNSKAITIKWGFTNTEKDSVILYLIKTDRRIYQITKDKNHNETLNHINTLNEEKFCSILNHTTKTMLKTQILNEPCKECKFIEWSNPNMNINIRFNWNSNYIHSGTKMVSELFDSLMTITILTQ